MNLRYISVECLFVFLIDLVLSMMRSDEMKSSTFFLFFLFSAEV